MNATVCQTVAKAIFKLRAPLLFLGIAGLASSASAAASYCTAIYSVQITATGTQTSPTSQAAVTAINPATGTVLRTMPSTSTPNAAALNPSDGFVYYFDRASYPPTLYKIDPNSASPNYVSVGTMKNTRTTTSGNTTSNVALIGATFDNLGNMLAYWADKTISKVDMANLQFGTFVPVTGNDLTTGTTNGDIAYDSSGQLWAVGDDSTGNSSLFRLTSTTTTDPNTGAVTMTYAANKTASITSGGVNLANINGLAIDPVTGKFYVSLRTALYVLDSSSSGAATQTGSLANVTDLASCGTVPNLPTLSKGFSPASVQAPATTSTLTITVGNSNLAPYYLTSPVTDTMPSGMTVTTSSLGGNCTGVTATTTTITLPAGSTIPANGCNITATVNIANTPGTYVNTIASGNLQTTSGTANTQATATLVSNSAPTIAKAFSPTAVLQGATSTLTFTLTNPNPSGQGLTNLNFTDALSGMSVASTTVGGTCTGVSGQPAVGATQIALTVASLAGNNTSCTLTVTVTGNTIKDNPNTTSGVTSTQTPTAGAVSNTAILTVNGVPNVVLSKLVRNIGTVLNPATQSKAAFSNTGVSALPGAYLEYCINYQNTGTGRVTNLVINDSVVSTTTGQLDGYGTGLGVLFADGATVANGATADPKGTAVSSSGTLTATKLSYPVGNLAAGAQGSVCFKAKVS